MKKKSARIKELQELIREGENYQRLKPVHTELNNIKFKKQREKFEHPTMRSYGCFMPPAVF